MTTDWSVHAAGRTALLRCKTALMDGPDPEVLVRTLARGGARDVLVDATSAPWADSDGLRWLLAFQNTLQRQGLRLRVVARREGKVWRNVSLLNAGLSLFPSVRAAWHG